MCSKTSEETDSKSKRQEKESASSSDVVPPLSAEPVVVDTKNMSPSSPQIRRRTKRIKQGDVASLQKHNAAVKLQAKRTSASASPKTKRRSRAKAKHEADKPSGGVEAILPSLGIVAVLAFAVMAKMGFRGRADVAGIDLGTTNSVVCVQSPLESAGQGGVGKIECIPDPANGSPIVPSVVSFLDHAPGSGSGGNVDDRPNVVVGHKAKMRIDTHPHHTLYHAKRVIGRSFEHDSVKNLMEEVEFNVVNEEESVAFRIPYHSTAADGTDTHKYLHIKPQQVGSYVVDHLISMTKKFLGHENVKTAVIAIPAKFSNEQRIATVQAFTGAGVKVARILEEPTAAALAYGLDKKDGVNYIMVYDFGGGTLDVSILHVSDGGYVDVMGSDGDNRLGGADFDAAVAHALMDKDGGEKTVQRVTDALERIETKLKKEGVVDAEDDLEELLGRGVPSIGRDTSLHPLIVSHYWRKNEDWPFGVPRGRRSCRGKLPRPSSQGQIQTRDDCRVLLGAQAHQAQPFIKGVRRSCGGSISSLHASHPATTQGPQLEDGRDR